MFFVDYRISYDSLKSFIYGKYILTISQCETKFHLKYAKLSKIQVTFFDVTAFTSVFAF